MKLIATKTETAGEMMLTEINPWNAKYQPRMYKMFEETRQDMLTDDPSLQEGQEVEREEYEVVEQCKFNNTWLDARGSEYADPTLNTRGLLRRKAVAEKQAGEWVSVEEARPKEGQIILAIGDGKSASMCKYVNSMFERYIDTTDHDRFIVIAYTHITHWMPLPKPPQQ